MATIKHAYVSAQADGGDTSLVQPSDWNADHSIVGTIAVANGGTASTTAADARTALGLAIGTNVQAYNANLDEYAAVNPTAAGLAILDDATVGDQRTTLGLGNSATLNTGTTAGTVATGDHNHTGVYEPANANLLETTDIGVSVQAYDVELAAIAGLISASDKLPYFTGAGTAGVTDFTATARTLMDDASVSAMRSTLGLAIGTDVPAYGAVIGKVYLGYWPAAALKPSVTNGMDALVWDESGTNDVMDGYLGASASADQYAQFEFLAPQSLDEGTFLAKFNWKEAGGATAHNVVWQIEIQAQSDGDTLDSAWGTAQTVQDTGTNATTRRISADTSAITPGGTWAAGDVIKVRVSRKASDTTNDTLDVKAHLLGVVLYGTNTTLVEP